MLGKTHENQGDNVATGLHMSTGATGAQGNNVNRKMIVITSVMKVTILPKILHPMTLADEGGQTGYLSAACLEPCWMDWNAVLQVSRHLHRNYQSQLQPSSMAHLPWRIEVSHLSPESLMWYIMGCFPLC